MKTIAHTLCLLAFTFITLNATAQSTPDWVRTINGTADTSYLTAVRGVGHDINGNIYVLSIYAPKVGILAPAIHLAKFDYLGAPVWDFNYDNLGKHNVAGDALAVDDNGNCYIAGFLDGTTSNPTPLLLKVNSNGTLAWRRDTTATFNEGRYTKVLLQKNRVYLCNNRNGIAMYNTNGTEVWSDTVKSTDIALDNLGRVSTAIDFSASSPYLYRFDSTGALSFSDNAMEARAIATDFWGNLYLFRAFGMQRYELMKYDSAGTHSWTISSFPKPKGPFGDFTFDLMTDYDLNVVLVGLADSIFKVSPAGTVLWGRPMDVLDENIYASMITYDNFIALAGEDSVGGSLSVNLYNLHGARVWNGYYNGFTGDESSFYLTVSGTDILVAEQAGYETKLVKFGAPFLSNADYSLVCIDSVWYDPSDPHFVNVRVFNGSTGQMNYPSVQAYNASNDTVINPKNTVYFFAHGPNGYTTYRDTITDGGITDFTTLTYLISERFGDTTATIGWCIGSAILPEVVKSELIVYPNPTTALCVVRGAFSAGDKITITDRLGRQVFTQRLTQNAEQVTLDVSHLAAGLYFITLRSNAGLVTRKFIKEL